MIEVIVVGSLVLSVVNFCMIVYLYACMLRVKDALGPIVEILDEHTDKLKKVLTVNPDDK